MWRVGLVLAVIVFYVVYREEKVSVERAPARTVLKARPLEHLKFEREEVYKFHKSVQVKFDFSHEVISQGFDGYMFMNWEGERVAKVTLSMPGHDPQIFVKAHFSDNHDLDCVEVPKNLTESEADYALLMKNLVLDYSFKTNRDDNGDYLAFLSIKEISDGRKVFQKVKSKYLDSEKSGIRIEKSLHEIKLHHGLVEARGEEEIQLLFKGAGKTAKAHSRYLLAVSEVKERPLVDWGRELSECSRDFVQEVKIDKQLSLLEFKDQLFRMKELNRGARHFVMRKIVRGLKANPEYLAEFMDWVHSVLDDRKMAALALGMLGSLKTAESRRELQGIYDGVTERTEYLRHQVENVVILNADD